MSKKKPNRETTAIAKLYEPTPDERAAREAVHSRRKTPRVKVSQKERLVNLSLDCPEESYGQFLLMEALGTVEPDFSDGILKVIFVARASGEPVKAQQAPSEAGNGP